MAVYIFGFGESTWDEVIGSKDPTVFTVFLEDSAGLIGAAFAFMGIFLGRLFHNPYLDPIASILVGLLLGAVALLLGCESGALLVGERTNRWRIRRIRKIIRSEPSVEGLGKLLTMQLEPEEVLLTVGIRFRRGLTVTQLESTIHRIEGKIQEIDPTIKQIFIEADPLKHDAKPSKTRELHLARASSFEDLLRSFRRAGGNFAYGNMDLIRHGRRGRSGRRSATVPR